MGGYRAGLPGPWQVGRHAMSVSRCGPHEVGDCGVVCLPSAQRYCSVASRAHFPLATYTTDCAARRRQRLVRRSPVSTGGSLPSYLCLCERDQQPKRVVYGRRIAEDGGDIRIEENNICALSITLVVLAPHGSAEVVFREEVVVLRLASRTHTVSCPPGDRRTRSTPRRRTRRVSPSSGPPSPGPTRTARRHDPTI